MVTLHTTKISKSQIKKAEKCLADNGVEKDETETVLQALGYILLDVELYPENDYPYTQMRTLWHDYCTIITKH